MTSKERVMAAINRQTPDRVPCTASLVDVDVKWLCETFDLAGESEALVRAISEPL